MNKRRGRDFNESPLSFEEFVSFDEGSRIYNNFLLNLGYFNLYEKLRKINNVLADNLKGIAINYFNLLKKEEKPNEDWQELGYKAYLILRENYKNDEALRTKILAYYGGKKPDYGSDDWVAFFA